MHFVTKNSQFVNCVPNKICHFSLFCINLVNFTELLHCFTEFCRNCLGKIADKTGKKQHRRREISAAVFSRMIYRYWFVRVPVILLILFVCTSAFAALPLRAVRPQRLGINKVRKIEKPIISFRRFFYEAACRTRIKSVRIIYGIVKIQ